MKKLFSIFLALTLALSSFAQDTTKIKPHNNEFGIDISGFLRQYLNIGDNSQFPEYYTPTYYLTYRRHFSCGNLRIKVGGNFANVQEPGENSDDTANGYSNSYSLNASIGWECYNNLGKKWQVYYGADLVGAFSYSRSNRSNIYGPNYSTGEISKSQLWGFSPFLGIRFNITKRLSILTEASFAINWTKVFTGYFYLAESGFTGTLPPTNSNQYIRTYSSFSQPLSVFIDFRI